MTFEMILKTKMFHVFVKLATCSVFVTFLLIVAGCGTKGDDIKADLEFSDQVDILSTAKGRNISVRVLTPEGCNACPLIIFSHGANAAYDRYDALLLPLARAGYRVAAPNHTDSEEHPDRADFGPPDWLLNRLEDYDVIASRYETNYRIAAGHSFGGLVAQIAGGAEIASAAAQVNPAYRPNAVLAYSPPGPIPNYIEPQGWSKISVPMLVTMGTEDIVPMMAEQWELHLVSFESAPPNLSFALIYENMDHYMNGAYGRETDAKSPERDQALKHMTEASLFFLSKLRSSGTMSAKDWETQEQTFVETRARS